MKQLAIGVQFIGALENLPEAQMALSYRYQYGHDVSLDIETAAQYSYLAAQG
jgi:hypothetical protein